MGGYGSGRTWAGRDTTDDLRRIDVRWMARKGYLENCSGGTLEWSRRGERIAWIQYRAEKHRMVLTYKVRERGADWESLEYGVELDRTPCQFGGHRVWFRCPARGCGRRVATVFGGRIFACRRCHGLAYQSQRQSRSDRATDRAEHILKRLGCEDMTIFDAHPPSPKGMHHRTYRKLAARYESERFDAFRFGPAGVMGGFEPGSTQ